MHTIIKHQTKCIQDGLKVMTHCKVYCGKWETLIGATLSLTKGGFCFVCMFVCVFIMQLWPSTSTTHLGIRFFSTNCWVYFID